LESADEFAEFAERVKSPLMANMTEFGKSPPLTVDALGAMGYAMVVFPMSAFRVMMKAAEEVYSAIEREGTSASFLDRMQTRKELYDLVGYAGYEELERGMG
jgi:methylisocitrate lyase